MEVRLPSAIRIFFFGLGLVILGVTAALWLLPAEDSTSTVAETSSVEVTSTPSPGAGTTTGEASAGSGQSTPSSSSTVSTKKTETTNPPASRRSDAVLALLVALGVALVFMGAFYDRITSIKAAGVEVGLAARVTEAIAAKTTPETPEDRDKVRMASLLALEQLMAGGGYYPPTSSGDDPVIESAAEWALRSVNADFE